MAWKGEAKEAWEREDALARARVRRVEEAEEKRRKKELGEMVPVEEEEEEEAAVIGEEPGEGVLQAEMDGVEEDLVEVVIDVEPKGPKRKRASLGGDAAGVKRKKA